MNELFHKALQTAALQALQRFELSGQRVTRWTWDDTSAHILLAIVQAGILSKEDVVAAVDLRLKRLGRESYEHCVRFGYYAEHAISPEALAYALHRGQFTRDEVKRLRFDHGDTETTFVEDNHAHTLPEKVYTQLLNLNVPHPI